MIYWSFIHSILQPSPVSALLFHGQLIQSFFCVLKVFIFFSSRNVGSLPWAESSKEVERWSVHSVCFSEEGQALSLNLGVALYKLPLPSELRNQFCLAQDTVLNQIVFVYTSVGKVNICTELLSHWAHSHCLVSSTCCIYFSSKLYIWGNPFISYLHRA